MKINFLGKQIINLDGTPIPGGMMNNMVADMLATSRGGDDPVKLYELAVKVKWGEFDADSADLDLIDRVIRGHEGVQPLGKGQILIELGEQRRAGK